MVSTNTLTLIPLIGHLEADSEAVAEEDIEAVIAVVVEAVIIIIIIMLVDTSTITIRIVFSAGTVRNTDT